MIYEWSGLYVNFSAIKYVNCQATGTGPGPGPGIGDGDGKWEGENGNGKIEMGK